MSGVLDSGCIAACGRVKTAYAGCSNTDSACVPSWMHDLLGCCHEAQPGALWESKACWRGILNRAVRSAPYSLALYKLGEVRHERL